MTVVSLYWVVLCNRQGGVSDTSVVNMLAVARDTAKLSHAHTHTHIHHTHTHHTRSGPCAASAECTLHFVLLYMRTLKCCCCCFSYCCCCLSYCCCCLSCCCCCCLSCSCLNCCCCLYCWMCCAAAPHRLSPRDACGLAVLHRAVAS